MIAWARDHGVFDRNKLPIQKKVLAAIMSSSGLSYREVARLLGGISYVAVRDAQHAFGRALRLPEKKYRGRIALEESIVQLSAVRLHFWLARDLENGELLAVQASRTATVEESEGFLNRVLQCCNNRPMAVLDRKNYPKSIRNIDVKFQISTSPGIRERFGRLLKEKTELGKEAVR